MKVTINEILSSSPESKLAIVAINRREAVMIIQSLTNQLLAKSCNVGRAEFITEKCSDVNELTICITENCDA